MNLKNLVGYTSGIPGDSFIQPSYLYDVFDNIEIISDRIDKDLIGEIYLILDQLGLEKDSDLDLGSFLNSETNLSALKLVIEKLQITSISELNYLFNRMQHNICDILCVKKIKNLEILFSYFSKEQLKKYLKGRGFIFSIDVLNNDTDMVYEFFKKYHSILEQNNYYIDMEAQSELYYEMNRFFIDSESKEKYINPALKKILNIDDIKWNQLTQNENSIIFRLDAEKISYLKEKGFISFSNYDELLNMLIHNNHRIDSRYQELLFSNANGMMYQSFERIKTLCDNIITTKQDFDEFMDLANNEDSYFFALDLNTLINYYNMHSLSDLKKIGNKRKKLGVYREGDYAYNYQHNYLFSLLEYTTSINNDNQNLWELSPKEQQLRILGYYDIYSYSDLSKLDSYHQNIGYDFKSMLLQFITSMSGGRYNHIFKLYNINSSESFKKLVDSGVFALIEKLFRHSTTEGILFLKKVITTQEQFEEFVYKLGGGFDLSDQFFQSKLINLVESYDDFMVCIDLLNMIDGKDTFDSLLNILLEMGIDKEEYSVFHILNIYSSVKNEINSDDYIVHKKSNFIKEIITIIYGEFSFMYFQKFIISDYKKYKNLLTLDDYSSMLGLLKLCKTKEDIEKLNSYIDLFSHSIYSYNKNIGYLISIAKDIDDFLEAFDYIKNIFLDADNNMIYSGKNLEVVRRIYPFYDYLHDDNKFYSHLGLFYKDIKSLKQLIEQDYKEKNLICYTSIEVCLGHNSKELVNEVKELKDLYCNNTREEGRYKGIIRTIGILDKNNFKFLMKLYNIKNKEDFERLLDRCVVQEKEKARIAKKMWSRLENIDPRVLDERKTRSTTEYDNLRKKYYTFKDDMKSPILENVQMVRFGIYNISYLFKRYNFEGNLTNLQIKNILLLSKLPIDVLKALLKKLSITSAQKFVEVFNKEFSTCTRVDVFHYEGQNFYDTLNKCKSYVESDKIGETVQKIIDSM